MSLGDPLPSLVWPPVDPTDEAQNPPEGVFAVIIFGGGIEETASNTTLNGSFAAPAIGAGGGCLTGCAGDCDKPQALYTDTGAFVIAHLKVTDPAPRTNRSNAVVLYFKGILGAELATSFSNLINETGYDDGCALTEIDEALITQHFTISPFPTTGPVLFLETVWSLGGGSTTATILDAPQMLPDPGAPYNHHSFTGAGFTGFISLDAQSIRSVKEYSIIDVRGSGGGGGGGGADIGVKVWHDPGDGKGTRWVEHPADIYDGIAWKRHPVKVTDGSTWKRHG